MQNQERGWFQFPETLYYDYTHRKCLTLPMNATSVARIRSEQHSIRQHTSAYVSICQMRATQHTSAYVSICQMRATQHTSAYVSIRQHTSAYVRCEQHSIRQHTSAYVSIRQHMSDASNTGASNTGCVASDAKVEAKAARICVARIRSSF
jgi:hypothetical protein